MCNLKMMMIGLIVMGCVLQACNGTKPSEDPKLACF
ncbi:hypothetical protein AALP_AAs67435U000500 [Arabis alpina]|uniref:Uncharacterized protein n=1 Tax=Arabis alpina TaxID=50452 RepID=A0A087FZK8_ARAAL|nr:hypothetical protein AALP_AAs67435U000500 [Arabis alpina]